jgi:rhodanese-related sulfurtransferase
MTSMALPATAASVLLAPAAFAAVMAEPGRVTIDVHVPFEGKLNATDLMIPYTEIAQRESELPADRGTPMAIYCRSGFMSAIAAPELAALGFTDVVELSGGMDAWRASGLTLITTN